MSTYNETLSNYTIYGLKIQMYLVKSTYSNLLNCFMCESSVKKPRIEQVFV